MRSTLEKRAGTLKPVEPKVKTKLFLKKKREAELANNAEREHQKHVEAVQAFMQALSLHDSGSEYIDRSKLKDALEGFPSNHYNLLFGDGGDVDTICDLIDTDRDGQVQFAELVQLIESKGVRMQDHFLGYGRGNVTCLKAFVGAVAMTMSHNTQHAFVKHTDVDRTIGINTGHVGSFDYSQEEPDREFIKERGYNATEACFRHFAYNKTDLVKERVSHNQVSSLFFFATR